MKPLLIFMAVVLITPSLSAQKVSERRYTVREIDELRGACRDRYKFGTTYFEFATSGASRWSHQYRENEMVVAAEETLRTYMLAGITAEQIWEEDKRLAKERYLLPQGTVFFNVSHDTVYIVPAGKQKKGKR